MRELFDVNLGCLWRWMRRCCLKGAVRHGGLESLGEVGRQQQGGLHHFQRKKLVLIRCSHNCCGGTAHQWQPFKLATTRAAADHTTG